MSTMWQHRKKNRVTSRLVLHYVRDPSFKDSPSVNQVHPTLRAPPCHQIFMPSPMDAFLVIVLGLASLVGADLYVLEPHEFRKSYKRQIDLFYRILIYFDSDRTMWPPAKRQELVSELLSPYFWYWQLSAILHQTTWQLTNLNPLIVPILN